MSHRNGSSPWLDPDRFQNIQTPPIVANGEHAMSQDGLPAFSRLDVLVAYLTAPHTVNEEVMTDFLMTFREFATCRDVWNLLASRLLWAAETAARTGTESEQGKDCGTRCFVVMRQWVRDYFATDFLPDPTLRVLVAETVTALAGCSEFVLLDFFGRMISQFRAVWDTKINENWVLDERTLGNVEYPTPAGGEDLSAFSSKSLVGIHTQQKSLLLAGEIPIDADIAVTSIHTSPQRQKPRNKLSRMFHKSPKPTTSPDETDVVLQNRVDLLAMQIIDEYHDRERQTLIPNEPAPPDVFSQLGSAKELSRQMSSDLINQMASASNPQIIEDRGFHDAPQDIQQYDTQESLEVDSFVSDPEVLDSKASIHSLNDHSDDQKAVLDRSPTPVTEIEDDDEWATPRRGSGNRFSEPVFESPSNEHELPMSHEKSADTLNMHSMGLANTSGESEIEFEQENEHDDFDQVNFDDFDKASFHGSSLSTLSTHSAFSFHGENQPAYQDHSFNVLRQMHHGLPQTDSQTDSQTTSGSTSRKQSHEFSTPSSNIDRLSFHSQHSDISLISEYDNSKMVPCPGFTASDREVLKALPDDEQSGDALLKTLQKLEGADEARKPQEEAAGAMRQAALGSLTSTLPRSSTMELYQQALDTDHTPRRTASDRRAQELDQEISQLGIALNDAHSHHFHGERVPNKFDLASPFGMSPLDQNPLDQPELPHPLPTLRIGLPGASHAPFILAFSARAVAEQMTLVEREVLRGLECDELLRMQWQHPPQPSSWLQVVMSDPRPQGIALVQSRFNLVYRWVQSEVLLCPHPGLQTQAISRFVQIAFESLRLQNFATMVQLVLALSSDEVKSRVDPAVFDLLPAHDRDCLDRLAMLTSSQQNYAKLRQAHKRYAWWKGCVPFITIFLRDIELTSQASSFNDEQEIHFGKYRVCAHLVKSLRRAVESTINYNFALDTALFSKCLYLSSLPELSTI